MGPSTISDTFSNLSGCYVLYNTPVGVCSVRLSLRFSSGVLDKPVTINVPCYVSIDSHTPHSRIITISDGFQLPDGSGNVGEGLLTAHCYASEEEDEKELASNGLMLNCW